MRPAGRLCTELHRHLTNLGPDTEEEEEEEEESESEEDEEEESGSSEVEGATPGPPQFSSEAELRSVVELITYMHTYCLPSRKQQRSRAPPTATNSHTRVVLVTAPGGAGAGAPRKLPFARRREAKADSLLRQLLQRSAAVDVSKPYRLHSPPYAHAAPAGQPAQAPPLSSSSPEPEPEPGPDPAERGGGSFSVRRSLRLASFPSRFAKRLRPIRFREGEGLGDKGAAATGGGTPADTQPQRLAACEAAELSDSCCHQGKTAPAGC